MEAVQRMQDYIEQHLSENITLAGYIRRLRLSKSALKLRDERCKIIDIALELGFGSADGYQRAFLREFGCNPGEYAKSPVPLYLFTPYGVSYQKNRKEKLMEHVKTVLVREGENRCSK